MIRMLVVAGRLLRVGARSYECALVAVFAAAFWWLSSHGTGAAQWTDDEDTVVATGEAAAQCGKIQSNVTVISR